MKDVLSVSCQYCAHGGQKRDTKNSVRLYYNVDLSGKLRRLSLVLWRNYAHSVLLMG